MRPRAGLRRLGAVVAVLLVVLLPLAADAAVLKRGSRGDEVVTLQKKLKQWGYYDGSVDGVFGAGTEKAVQYFQRKNGLTADGVVGAKTAAALGMTLSGSGQTAQADNSSDRSVRLLAACIYGESRGEPYKGQVAVGAVILNRVKSSKFPNSIAGVIYQPGAFDAVSDGQIDLGPNETALRAARDAMNGYDPTYGCLYYYNPATTTNKWMLSKPVALRIGRHVFCY
jgi:N-acetylmuramoyl-L-alanine amidase